MSPNVSARRLRRIMETIGICDTCTGNCVRRTVCEEETWTEK